ncbi:MAG TPA: protein kinase [Polyangia bacterium]|nr:protein kinase [Polyangia bacterium]
MSPGARLNDTYEVVRLLGRGGMGEVYEVRNVRLAGRYAVKVLRADISRNEELLSRFRREAQITSALAHPNIVQVFDFNRTPDGQWFLAMEFLAGGDLADLIKREGPLPLARALAIINQIASALAATHSRGIIHRDLKPGNVFVVQGEGEGTTGDRIKLVDFGLSKRSAELVTSVAYSHEDALIGTPLYMAPEQALAQNHKLSAATDQYALAVLLFEMLTGRRPFPDQRLTDVLHAIAYQTPPLLSTFRPDVPAGVASAIERAFSKEPSERHQSVRQFVEAVEMAVAAPAVLAAVTPPRRRRRSFAVPTVAVVVLAVLVLSGWLARRSAGIHVSSIDPASTPGSPPTRLTGEAVIDSPAPLAIAPVPARRDHAAHADLPPTVAGVPSKRLVIPARPKLSSAHPPQGAARPTEVDPLAGPPPALPAANQVTTVAAPDPSSHPGKPAVVPHDLVDSL